MANSSFLALCKKLVGGSEEPAPEFEPAPVLRAALREAREKRVRSEEPYRVGAYWFRRLGKTLQVWIRGDFRSKRALASEILTCAWEVCHQIDPQEFPAKLDSVTVGAFVEKVWEQQKEVEYHHHRSLPRNNTRARIAMNNSYVACHEPELSEEYAELEESYEGSEARVQRR